MSIESRRSQITANNELIKAKSQEVYDAGVEDGKKAEYDAFWDVFQGKAGGRTNYTNAFSYSGWQNANFKPKHKIKPQYASQMFYSTSIADVAAPLKDLPLDFSKCRSYGSLCQSSMIEHFPPLNVAESTATNQTLVFHNCQRLHTIDLLTVAEHNTFQNWFSSCPLLENIAFEGTIANDISFADSPKLTLDSLLSIIRSLADFTGTENEHTRTLTLSQASVDILNADNISWIGSMVQIYKKWSLEVL